MHRKEHQEETNFLAKELLYDNGFRDTFCRAVYTVADISRGNP